jgi:putative MATE family efflux protein
MVSHLGPAALAGVGLASFLNFMAFSAITGLSPAVQAMASRRVGEGHLDETAVPLNGGILLSLAIGVPLCILLFIAAPTIFARLNDDPAVVAQGSRYLQYRLIGIAAVGINFSFRGYWSAVRNTGLYMLTLFGMNALNVVLDWLLIFGKLGLPAMGVRGAGLASLISTVFGTLTYCVIASRHSRSAGFLVRMPSRRQFIDLLRIGLPSCIQQLLFAAGFVVLFWIVGRIGTAELAVTNVLVQITLTAVLPAIALGLAAATFAGQALGRGNVAEAARWPWAVYRSSAWVFAIVAAVMLIATEPVLGLFLNDARHPENVSHLIDLGRFPLRLIGSGILLDALGFIVMQALLGVGASLSVMLVSIGLQWGLFLPAAYLLGPVLGAGFATIWIAMFVYRTLQTLIFVILWQRRRWAQIAV